MSCVLRFFHPGSGAGRIGLLLCAVLSVYCVRAHSAPTEHPASRLDAPLSHYIQCKQQAFAAVEILRYAKLNKLSTRAAADRMGQLRDASLIRLVASGQELSRVDPERDASQTLFFLTGVCETSRSLESTTNSNTDPARSSNGAVATPTGGSASAFPTGSSPSSSGGTPSSAGGGHSTGR